MPWEELRHRPSPGLVPTNSEAAGASRSHRLTAGTTRGRTFWGYQPSRNMMPKLPRG